MIYCSREDNREGRYIQCIAGQLRKFIEDSEIKDVSLYCKLLQYSKNPKKVEEVVSYIDGYYQTKEESYIKNLFSFLFKKVQKHQAALAQLP